MTLTLRGLVPLSLVYIGFALLDAALEFATAADFGRTALGYVDSLSRGPSSVVRAIVRDSVAPPPPVSFGSLVAVALLALAPLPLGALVLSAARIASGEPARIVDAYRVALRRWTSLAAIELAFGLGFALFVLALALAFATVYALAGAVGAAAPATIVVGAIGVLAIVPIWSAIALLAFVAANVAFCACLLDGVSVRAAIGGAMRRVTTSARAELCRLVAIGGAVAAITLAGLVAQDVATSFAVLATHSALLGDVICIPIDVGGTVFLWAFVTLFYVDLGVRENGVDLALAARSLLPPA